MRRVAPVHGDPCAAVRCAPRCVVANCSERLLACAAAGRSELCAFCGLMWSVDLASGLLSQTSQGNCVIVFWLYTKFCPTRSERRRPAFSENLLGSHQSVFLSVLCIYSKRRPSRVVSRLSVAVACLRPSCFLGSANLLHPGLKHNLERRRIFLWSAKM